MKPTDNSFRTCLECSGNGFSLIGPFGETKAIKCLSCKGLGFHYLNPVPEKT